MSRPVQKSCNSDTKAWTPGLQDPARHLCSDGKRFPFKKPPPPPHPQTTDAPPKSGLQDPARHFRSDGKCFPFKKASPSPLGPSTPQFLATQPTLPKTPPTVPKASKRHFNGGDSKSNLVSMRGGNYYKGFADKVICHVRAIDLRPLLRNN